MKSSKPYSIALLLSLFIFSVSCTSSEKENKKEPAAKAEARTEESAPEKHYLDLNVKEISNLERGDIYTLPLDSSRTLTLKIRRVQIQVADVQSVAADIEDKETGLASLVIQNGKAAGTLNIFNEAEILFVRFDSVRQQHYYEVVNKKDLDIMEGSKPLEAPNQKH